MKHLFPFVLALFAGFVAIAQTPVTTAEIPGAYQISKMYINDTLFYDAGNPAKSNKNILVEIGKANPIAFQEDSTVAIYLFYKDIYKALNTNVVLLDNGSMRSDCRSKTDRHTRLVFPNRFGDTAETWKFDEKKQLLIINNGKEKYPVVRIDEKPVIVIEDKKERTKIEMKRIN
ncbi:MAG: hypothetical protein M0D57_15865 [Sphingobacteriales bacterium JAD_PAG50586_3]|nr:MAG: hypothetical protein M0D57_15865 [Sphingobacteriales bacterium JAD_PAG50586_3]